VRISPPSSLSMRRRGHEHKIIEKFDYVGLRERKIITWQTKSMKVFFPRKTDYSNTSPYSSIIYHYNCAAPNSVARRALSDRVSAHSSLSAITGPWAPWHTRRRHSHRSDVVPCSRGNPWVTDQRPLGLGAWRSLADESILLDAAATANRH